MQPAGLWQRRGRNGTITAGRAGRKSDNWEELRIMKRLLMCAMTLVFALGTAALGSDSADDKAENKPQEKIKNVYEFEMDSIDAKPVKLSKYDGLVLMIVNVASK